MAPVQQKIPKTLDPSFVHNVKILKSCLDNSKTHVCTITLNDGRTTSQKLSHDAINTLIHSIAAEKIFFDGTSSDHYSHNQVPLSERKAIHLLLAELFEFKNPPSNSTTPLIAPPETKEYSLSQKMLVGFALGYFVSLAYFYSKANEVT